MSELDYGELSDNSHDSRYHGGGSDYESAASGDESAMDDDDASDVGQVGVTPTFQLCSAHKPGCMIEPHRIQI